MWSQGQFSVLISEKEPFRGISRSRVKLWGWSLEDEEAKELIGQWFDGTYGKTLRQMSTSSIAKEE